MSMEPAIFDLMKDKPALDVPTLNWVWDSLWRRRQSNFQKNEEQRIRAREDDALMVIVESEARAAIAKAGG
ncbi:hypothetical protein M0R72_08865 [Candidatus Pacearchaeota archaeon]|nr:hypothetical protein [Candidatus Pacearchaeota archaeon]